MARFVFAIALALFAAACGAHSELVASDVDAGAGTGGASRCPLGESPKSPGYCICQDASTCPSGYACCMPFHVTADIWPSVCAPPGDPICASPSSG